MTKQHFITAAKIVADIRTGQSATPLFAVSDAAMVANAYAVLFQQYNPRFDVGRFLTACGFPDYHDLGTSIEAGLVRSGLRTRP